MEISTLLRKKKKRLSARTGNRSLRGAVALQPPGQDPGKSDRAQPFQGALLGSQYRPAQPAPAVTEVRVVAELGLPGPGARRDTGVAFSPPAPGFSGGPGASSPGLPAPPPSAS